MSTASELIDRFGGPTAFGRVIEVRPSAASEMKRRQSIPVIYWKRLIDAAQERAFLDVTYESLVVMHSPPQAPDARNDDQHQHADDGAATDTIKAHEGCS